MCKGSKWVPGCGQCRVNIACLDPDTGKVIWQRYIEPRNPHDYSSGIAVRPVANSDDVFFLYYNVASTGPTSLERISASGTRVWQDLVNPFPSANPAFPNPFSTTVPSSPGIWFDADSDGNVVVCASMLTGITKYDGETGSVLWGPILESASDPDGKLIGNVICSGNTVVLLRSFPSIAGKTNITRVSAAGSVISSIDNGVWLRVSQPCNNFYALDDGTLVGSLLRDAANSLIYERVSHVDSAGVPITMSFVQPWNCFDVHGGYAISMTSPGGSNRNFARIDLSTGTATGKSPSTSMWSTTNGVYPSSVRMLDTSRFFVGCAHPDVSGAQHVSAFNFDDPGSSIAPIWTTRIGKMQGVGPFTAGVVDMCITSQSQRLVVCTNNFYMR